MRVSPSFIYAAAALAAAPTFVSAQDPTYTCAPLGQWFEEFKQDPGLTFSPTIAQSCLRAIPFDKEEAASVIESIRSLVPIIPNQALYTDETLPQLELKPFNINSTIFEIESKVNTGGYTNNFDFWMSVREAFEQFHDQHQKFVPQCSSFVEYVHDYPIVAIGSDAEGPREIWTVNLDAANMADTLDRKITLINGEPAADYLVKLANSLLEIPYADPDTRFNVLMSQHSGDPYERIGTFAHRTTWNEKTDQLNLTCEGGDVITVEWRAIFRSSISDAVRAGKFTTAPELQTAICYVSKEESKERAPEVAGPQWLGKEKGSDPSATVAPAAPVETSAGQAVMGYPAPAQRGPEDTVLVFQDEEDPSMSIVRVESFASSDNEDPEVFEDEYFKFVGKLFQGLKDKGTKRLLLDISFNGGGKQVHAVALLRSLFPKFAWSEKIAIQRRYSPMQETLLTKAAESTGYKPRNFDMENLQKSNGSAFADVKELLGPVNKRGDYFMASCSALKVRDEDDYQDLPLPAEAPWKPEDIAIVVNGYCGSACSTFLMYMTHSDVNVRVYAFGGRPNHKLMQAGGGTKGANVRDLKEYVRHSWMVLGDTSNTPDMPRWPKKTSLRSARVELETYIRTDDPEEMPYQFRYTPACKKLPFAQAMVGKVGEVWKATKKAAWKNDGSVIPCDATETAPKSTDTGTGTGGPAPSPITFDAVNGGIRQAPRSALALVFFLGLLGFTLL